MQQGFHSLPEKYTTQLRHHPPSTTAICHISFTLNSRPINGITTRRNTLNFNLRHLTSPTQTQIRLLRLRVLGVIIADRTLDRVFRQHTAMQLDRRQTQLLGYFSVADLAGLFESHAADEFGQVRRGGDGGAAAEGLEFDIFNCVGGRIDFDLEFHYVAAGGGAH